MSPADFLGLPVYWDRLPIILPIVLVIGALLHLALSGDDS